MVSFTVSRRALRALLITSLLCTSALGAPQRNPSRGRNAPSRTAGAILPQEASVGNSVDIRKQVEGRNSPSENLAGGGGSSSSLNREFGSVDNSIRKEDAMAMALDGDRLAAPGLPAARAPKAGAVLNGRAANDRLRDVMDNFRLPSQQQKHPIVLPGANVPKPIHVEVPPGPNSCCGDGDWDTAIRACICKKGYYGPRCQFKKVRGQSHGRYVCPKDCPRGVEQLPNGRCACPSGWKGQHCQIPDCLHGKLGCPTGNKFCVKSHCLCSPGWEGPRCGTKPVPKLPKANPFPMHAVKPKKKPATPCNGHDLPCQNTGTFNWETCRCACLPPYMGELCDKCIPQKCPSGKVQDPNTCGCICPASRTCKNNGVLNDDTCGCNCTNSWRGDSCDKCTPKSCNGHGVWDMKQCACLCDAPWLPDTQCRTCGSMDCGKFGTFQEKSCSCQCKGNWKGVQCDECPTKEERIVAGIDCGLHGWDEEKCQCKETCDVQACENGGRQDPNTCACACNVQGNGTDAVLKRDISKLKTATFWGGEVCQTCVEPANNPCPGSRKFNLTKCGCEDSCPNAKCDNGGVLNNATCTCDCPPGWGGKMCDTLADGTKKELAAVSCKAAQAVRPGNSPDGLYFINPTGTNPEENGFQVKCDMMEDGGGWIELANIGSNLKKAQLHADKYAKGFQKESINGEHIFPCNVFDGLDGGDADLENVVMRVTMGKVRDYFKPVSGKSLCDMLTSQRNHMWSANGGVPTKDGGGGSWLKPTYNQDPNLKELLGGSNNSYPREIDGRQFLSFWGGDNGGCCHKYSTIYQGDNGGADQPSWGLEFKIHIQEIVEPGKPVIDIAAENKANGKVKSSFLEIGESRINAALRYLQTLRKDRV
eukprot:g6804.t1